MCRRSVHPTPPCPTLPPLGTCSPLLACCAQIMRVIADALPNVDDRDVQSKAALLVQRIQSQLTPAMRSQVEAVLGEQQRHVLGVVASTLRGV